MREGFKLKSIFPLAHSVFGWDASSNRRACEPSETVCRKAEGARRAGEGMGWVMICSNKPAPLFHLPS